MRLTTTILLALLLLSQAPLAQDFKKATSMDQYERAMWQAIKDGKWLDVQAHMAESYVASTPLGVKDRAGIIEHFKQVKLAAFEISDLKSSPNGADMVVTYRLKARFPDGSEHQMQVLTVWQTVKRGWIQIAQSVLELPPSQP